MALATIALTVKSQGPIYAAAEAHSMIFGAIAFLIYALILSRILMKRGLRASRAARCCSCCGSP
ncbi:MAG TPA: hypothetical protein VN661_08285 [Candidatus Acidoferrales bacterium]|nr:hypothetical protein [Candidatus Acidoferrales bacterium]